jgi:hypothetical protein
MICCAVLCCAVVQATIYVYKLVDGEVKVEKIEHTKLSTATPSAAA